MYTILVKANDSLVATNKETVYHRSSNVRKLQFLVDPTFAVGGEILNMADLVCILEIKTPISDKYTPIVLTPSDELYKEKLEYIVDVDLRFTSEVGNVELQLLWAKPEMLASGTVKEYVRVTGYTTISVLKTNQWSDYVAESDLSNIAQMALTNQAQMEQLKLYADYLHMTKADTLKYDKETNKLSIGTASQELDSVILEDCDCEDGIPVVDFTTVEPDDPNPELDNVVEF